MSIEEAKRKAAEKAVELIKDGMVLGLGSGSTVAKLIEILAKKLGNEFTELYAIPTSYDTEFLARRAGLKIVSLEDQLPDLAIDGADEVDKEFNLIKGGGGCHTREKIIDYSSREFVVIVDYTKLVEKLGLNKPIPIEVIPFALRPAKDQLSKLGKVTLRYSSKGKLGPVITDNGNFILDLHYGKAIEDVEGLEIFIKTIPGVVETGLFSSKKVSKVIVGYPENAQILTK